MSREKRDVLGRKQPCIAAVSASWGEAGRSAVLWRALCEQRGLLLTCTADELDNERAVDFVAWRQFLRMVRGLNSCEGWLGEIVSEVSTTTHMMTLAEDLAAPLWVALTACSEAACVETSAPEHLQAWWQRGRSAKVSPELSPMVSPLHQCQFVHSGVLAVGLPSAAEDGQFWLALSSSFMEPTQLHLFVPIRAGSAVAELSVDVNMGRNELRVDFAEGDDVYGVLGEVWTAIATSASRPLTCLVALSEIADDTEGSTACSGFIPWKAGPPRLQLHGASASRFDA